MYPRPRRSYVLALGILAAVAVTLPSRADAVCSVSACDATALLSNAACCTASTCTIDGTLTVNGPTCTFDFGTRNLTVSGTVSAQGKTVTLKAKSMKLSGLLDVRGLSGANAGTVNVVTTGGTAVAFSQEGGTSAVINASSVGGNGGNISIQADGMVSFAKGSITADGGSGKSGGIIDIRTTAGDISVQIPISASSSTTALVPNGQILVTAPGNLTMGGSGRFVTDLGDIDVQTDGDAFFAEGALLQASLGGSIAVVAGSLTAFGEFRADGEGGSVDLRTVAGPLFLQRLSQGITVGPGVQSVALTTEAPGAAGLLTVDMPILAQGAEVEIESTGSIIISKKIETTGILDSEAGDISIDAEEDVTITKAIVGADIFGDADLSIDGRDVNISGNLDFRGGGETPGGRVDITADRDIHLSGDIFVNVSGADLSDAGTIDMQAARDLTIDNSVELIADGAPQAAGGTIFLVAGEGFGQRLPGNLTISGDIKANGHTVVGSLTFLQGCVVNIPAGAVIDVSGDQQSNNLVRARTSLTIGGQLKATAANILEFPVGATVSLPGSFAPARSAGACTNGTPTGNGCQRPVCTADNVPASCLYACPNCGDNQVAFPETCDIGSHGGPFCSGNDLCDARCRQMTCTTTNSCATPHCDAPTAACVVDLKPNGVECDQDANVCTGVGTCASGVCKPTAGSALHCEQDNPCTQCDHVEGCIAKPDGPDVPGCDDGLFCTGPEECHSGECENGPLPCTAPMVCNPGTESCDAPTVCVNPSDCPDDGNPCTQRVCNLPAGICGTAPLPGANCDDGDLCNGIRTCDNNGVCMQPSAPVDCNDNDVCTVDSCLPGTGQCVNAGTAGCCTTPGDCNDGNACTTDGCDANHECTHVAITCNDNNACTMDSCSPVGGCSSAPILPCDPCTDASDCDDDVGTGSECTDKACTGGRCVQMPNPNCCQTNEDCTDIDSNPCTNNGTCVANRCGPTTPLTGTPCGTTCNPATCQAGACQPGTPPNCTDNDSCTTDVCIDGVGCTHTHITDCCLAAADCTDTNVCTAETCDLDANLCEFPLVDDTCTPCTGTDPFECGPRCTTACDGGRCADVAANCDDADACTNDACEPTAGCTHTPRTDAAECRTCTDAGCADDDLCTDDRCADDGSACTHPQKTSYDSLYCRLDGMTAALNAASTDAVNDKIRKKTASTITKLRAKLDKAKAATKCKKSRNLIGSIRGPLRKLQRSLNKQAGRKIDATVATTLSTLAGEAANKADEVRSALGC